MPRRRLTGFRDPIRRPRYIIWGGVAVFALAAVTVVALGVTSTRWFCAEGCHKVQDDTIIAYERSAHSNISCMACHMPVNADPFTFLLHKGEALGELYLTATNLYELPLNPHSEVAFEMEERQCRQCHTLKSVTPSPGIRIDHEAHSEAGVQCTICHNRTAHVEDFELTLPGNEKHEVFMSMDACFRCHSQDGEGPTGGCAACHTEDFDLKPETHDVADFVRLPGDETAVHAKMAAEERPELHLSTEETATERPEETPTVTTEGETHAEPHEVAGFELGPVEEVDSCSTCHAQSFCRDCHGVDIPHPEDFPQTHPTIAEEALDSCAKCHLQDAAGMNECGECHHSMGDLSQPWMPQHFGVVREQGADQCFECHEPVYCAECHVGLNR